MFWNAEVGYKYRMSSLQAALGLAQLERVAELVSRKQEIFNWYRSELNNVDGVTLNYEPPGTKNAYWMVTVIVDAKYGLEKEKIMALLSQKSVTCRPIFYPLSSLPAYERLPQAKNAKKSNLNAYRISPYGVNLPSALNITQEQVRHVCEALKAILSQDP
jgi:perosamine synthetase